MVKSKLSPHKDSAALRQLNPIHKKGPQSDFFKELKDLKVRGGIVKLKQKLDKAFSRDKKKATYDACEKYLKDPNEMSSADYTIEFEELL